MAVTTLSCPECKVVLKPSATMTPGKKIKCPKCSHVFTIPRAKSAIEQEEEEESRGVYDFGQKEKVPEDTKPKKPKPIYQPTEEDLEEEEELKARLKTNKRPPKKRAFGGGGGGSDSPWLVPAILGGLLLILLGGGGYGAFYYFVGLNRNAGTGQEDLLAFAPADTNLLMGMRMSKLGDDPKLNEAFSQLAAKATANDAGQDSMDALVKASGLDWKDMFHESIIAMHNEGGPVTEMTVISKSKTPFDQNAVRKGRPDMVRERHNGKTYFKVENAKTGYKYLYMPSNQIMITTNINEDRLKKLIESDPTKPSITADFLGYVKQALPHDLWVVPSIDADMRRQLQQAPPQAAGSLASLKDMRGVTFWGNVSGANLRLHLGIHCGDEANARLVSAAIRAQWTQVKALISLASLPGARNAMPKSVTNLLKDLDGNMQFDSKGRIAEMNSQVKMQSLGDAIKELPAPGQGAIGLPGN